MFSTIKNLFNNKNRELELKEKELQLKQKELELKEQEMNLKKDSNKINTTEHTQENISNNPSKNKVKKEFREYTEEEKKEYALKMKEKKEKGKQYEQFVARYFKLDGYEVNLHGIKKGKKDKGIDIICSKDEELILIQCKNWKENSTYKINHEKLKAFVGCCTEYVNEHKLFDRNVKLKFITSNYILDESGKKFLEESKTLQYEILKF
jgi:restriction system protein